MLPCIPECWRYIHDTIRYLLPNCYCIMKFTLTKNEEGMSDRKHHVLTSYACCLPENRLCLLFHKGQLEHNSNLSFRREAS